MRALFPISFFISLADGGEASVLLGIAVSISAILGSGRLGGAST